MAKQINLIVNSCGECPYKIFNYSIGVTRCDCDELNSLFIKNFNIIHPDCPLEDVKEEKHCKDCKYCENDICWAETCEKFKAK